MLDDSQEIHPLFDGAPKSTDFKKLRKRIIRYVREAIEQYGMIERDARWLVCLSGGKDSFAMLDLLLSLQRSEPIRFEIGAVNLDQKQPGYPEHVLPGYLAARGEPFEIIEQDT